MKYYTKVTLITITALGLLTGCVNNKSNKASTKASVTETTQTSKKAQAETVSFFATGKYEVGVDINPGSYYIVLTDMRYSSTDEEKNAYVLVSVTDSNKESKFYKGIEEVGKPFRVTLEKGDKISFDDNYSPIGWNISFFTSEDYQEYQSIEKK